MNEIRLIIADDSEPMLHMLKGSCKPITLLLRAAVDAVRQLEPELVLLEISMPILDGFEAARQVKQLCPSTLLICVSEHREKVFAEAAFSVGGSGYVIKGKMIAESWPAIRKVLAGGEYGRPDRYVSSPGKLRRTPKRTGFIWQLTRCLYVSKSPHTCSPIESIDLRL